jgi:hypothetical protein
MWGALSDERMGLSSTIAAGPRQRSSFRVRVPWDGAPALTAPLLVLSKQKVMRTWKLTHPEDGGNLYLRNISTPPPYGIDCYLESIQMVVIATAVWLLRHSMHVHFHVDVYVVGTSFAGRLMDM